MRLPVGVLVLSLSLVAPCAAGAQSMSSSDSSRVGASATVSAGSMPAPALDVAPQESPTVADRRPASEARVDASLAGAPLIGLRAGVHARDAAPAGQPFVAPTAQRANLGEARAMMVVGVAGLIAGAVIGDTPGQIIMVGGAVIGLIGLYEYLK